MTTADPIAVLEAIVAEVAGAGQPFSADSYLPPHLVHDARMAIEAESKVATEWKAREAHEALLLARLAKADEMIASLRAEIDALRHPKIPGQPPKSMFGPGMAAPNPLLFNPAGKFLDQSLTLKYDPQACAESVRGMKECDA